MAARFPGAANLAQFWENMLNGIESISRLSDQELIAAGVPLETIRNPSYRKARGVLHGIEQFDAPFFGFTPMEAAMTDPQHRLLMECAWEAIESGGYDPEKYAGSIGLYAGTAISTYLFILASRCPQIWDSIGTMRLLLANDKDHIATRISYKLNLKGPSLNVNTECSSSLVAVHLACQSLLIYESDMALAGGACVVVPQQCGYVYEEGGIMSSDGHCRTFDAKATGTVPGNGAGMVLLKRLSDALADGDCIHAVIRGSAINNDGSLKVGYTAPSLDGQAAVVAKALGLAGVDASAIDYIEAHGTGTPVGDPIEIAALKKAFQSSKQRRSPCVIGALKQNIGHLGAAAGIAGLIKTVLALKHKRIPPLAYFHRLNPEIDLTDGFFCMADIPLEWERHDHPRTAGVSSFGIGGTNAHVIVEEAPTATARQRDHSLHVLPLSANSPAALDQLTRNLLVHLQGHSDIDMAAVAYTLQEGRKNLSHRQAVFCHHVADAIASLNSWDGNMAADGSPPSASRLAASCAKESAQREDAVRVLAQQWLSGVDVNWRQLMNPEPCRRVELPTYPFQRQRYWIELIEQSMPKVSIPANAFPAVGHDLNAHPVSTRADVHSPTTQDIVAPTTNGCAAAVAVPMDTTPRNWIEKEVCAVWRDVLGTEEIGINDNFFDLGGDSLVITQIVARFRARFHLEFPLSKFFDGPTVAEVAQVIAQLQIEQTTEAEMDEVLKEVRTLSARELQAELDSDVGKATAKEGSNE